MTAKSVKNLPQYKADALIDAHNQVVACLGSMGVAPHYSSPFSSTGALRAARVTTADASTLGTSKTLAKALAVALTAHGADTDMHASADTIACAAWASTPAEPADLTEVQNMANELKADFNTHIASATYHRAAGSAYSAVLATISTTDATNQGTANTLLNAIKVALNLHAQAELQSLTVVAS